MIYGNAVARIASLDPKEDNVNEWFSSAPEVNVVKLAKWLRKRSVSRAPNREYIIKKTLNEGDSPARFDFMKSFSFGVIRETYLAKYSHAIITNELVNSLVELCKGKKVVELGSGSGYLSHLLELKGMDITTVDTADWYTERVIRKPDIVGSYREMDFSDYDVVIMSWPNYESNAAAQVLKGLNENQLFIYCGEGLRGCCGDDDLHITLSQHWEHLKEDHGVSANSLVFARIKDYWTVYTKRKHID